MLLEVHQLSAGYGLKGVVHGVDLHVGEREVVAILGHNGVGKSTLLNALCGVNKPTAGRVLFNGRDITGRSPADNVPDGLSYAQQGADVFKTLSVTDNLMMGGFALADQAQVERAVLEVQELFPALKARANNKAGALSGGERQMLSIGMLLVASPKLVVLDEPSGGLSPMFVDRVYDTIADIRNRLGASVIVVEQDLSHVMAVADRAYVMANGKITFETSTKAPGALAALEQNLMAF